MITAYILMAVIAYAIGSVNFSVILSKKIAGFDVRERGSGNAGTTNMLRSVGKGPAILTLLLDILKGIVAILLAKFVVAKLAGDANPAILVQLAGFFVVVGHTFPIFFGFKGGKGVATSLGVLLVMNPLIGGICLVFALVVMALTRMVSLGSIMAAILFPVLTIFITYNYIADGYNYIIFGVAMAILVIFNHRSNIKRLYNGTENRLSFK
ncbi:MAG: glycerol-3-phosphate 1-O-acyltransferase PlsY [Clostridia bacterium]|nr:glycerol-3-phosphate 1-O-acyltransferase PlsY [Clostridia bacterium]MBR4261025.1 glycerol-3-phosphate 1-O-acyltransferase PlsY [Clostridia bacterium]